MYQSISAPHVFARPQFLTQTVAYIRCSLQKENSYLLPLRLFLGLGWLRASVEKLSDPAWHTGEALVLFFNEQIAAGAIAFPFYHLLVTELFLPSVAILVWLIMLGELLVGLAILIGAFTNLALLFGLLMNVNFLLAGVVNPSAFYIVIQSTLFASNVGATFGIDELLSRRVRSTFLVAQPKISGRSPMRSMQRRGGHVNASFTRTTVSNKPEAADAAPRRERRAFILVATLMAVAAIVTVPFVERFGPSSVNDPTMLIFILASLTSMLCTLLAYRTGMQNVTIE